MKSGNGLPKAEIGYVRFAPLADTPAQRTLALLNFLSPCYLEIGLPVQPTAWVDGAPAIG